jgi:hypothetical protein
MLRRIAAALNKRVEIRLVPVESVGSWLLANKITFYSNYFFWYNPPNPPPP